MITQKSKKVLLFAVLIISIFVMNLEEGKAACPSGYTPYDVTITYYYAGGSCDITIFYCYLNSPGGTHLLIIDEISIPYDCIGNVNFQNINFWDQINVAVYQDIINEQSLSIPPCSLGYKTIISVERTNCWKLVIPSNNEVSIQKCLDTGKCQIINRLCYNTNVTPYVLVNDKSSTAVTGETSCINGYVPSDYRFIIGPYDSGCFYTCE
jgi:hypothetical protein